MNPVDPSVPTEERRIAPAFAQRCKQLRHRQSNCRVCVETCPEGAIALDPGPSVSESCTRCGLCQVACPTEAFQGEIHPDQQLLQRIGNVLRPEGNAADGRGVFLHCREAEPQRRDSVAVPCLGSMTGNALLGAAGLGAKSVTLVHGDCDRCRLRVGNELFPKALSAYHVLAPVAGLNRATVKLEQRPRGDRALHARRRFLARVTGQRDGGPEDWPAPGTDAPAPPSSAGRPLARATAGRTLLQALLRGASWAPAPRLRCDLGLPWASLKIDQRDCAACGTCVNVCPTGAITRQIETSRLSHHFSGALCINCRLCEEACPQQVIGFDRELDARELLREDFRAITNIPLHECEVCGEVLPEREGRFCITCQRRGRVEGHAPTTVASP